MTLSLMRSLMCFPRAVCSAASFVVSAMTLALVSPALEFASSSFSGGLAALPAFGGEISLLPSSPGCTLTAESIATAVPAHPYANCRRA